MRAQICEATFLRLEGLRQRQYRGYREHRCSRRAAVVVGFTPNRDASGKDWNEGVTRHYCRQHAKGCGVVVLS